MARPNLLLSAGAIASALAGCFTGTFLNGQPCQSDADCGPVLRCEAGLCGGGDDSSTVGPTSVTPTGTGTTLEPTTAAPPPTTGGSDTTADPPSTEPSTGPVVDTTDGATTDGTTGEECGLGLCKDVDLLFVLDNSDSMAGESDTLIAALLAFNKFLLPEVSKACSLHVGATTTDDNYKYNPVECQKAGSLVRTNALGQMCEFTEGQPYATLADFDDPAKAACVFEVGTDGNPDERPINAMIAAAQPELNGPNGCNAGFLRKNGFIGVVLVTDEDDDDGDAQGHNGSTWNEGLWFDTFNALLGQNATVMMVGLLGDPVEGQPACGWDPLSGEDGVGAEVAPHLRAFIEKFPEDRRAIGSLCQPGGDLTAYDALMMEIADKVRTACQVP